MKRLLLGSLWLFFLPALLVWRCLVAFTLWLAGKAQALGPAYNPRQCLGVSVRQPRGRRSPV